MKKWYLFPALILLVLLINACQKEKSFEGGNNPALGSLQSETTGDCLPKTVGGIFEEGTLLDASNYIDVTVDVVTPGQYRIYTDTLNGIYFSTTGFFSTAGQATVRLRGVGTPLGAGNDNFTVIFGSSTCNVAVTTLPEGAGGPASYTLSGAPNACTNAVVEGLYAVGTPLNSTNTVTLQANVTTIGVYDITTTSVNGMIFRGTGTLGTTGPATIVLTGSGTPTMNGPSAFPVPGTSSCTFTVEVFGPAEYTFTCGTATVAGVYQERVPLDSDNYIEITINVTKAGAYNITGTANGMTFGLSGAFMLTGPQVIRIPASGTPTNDGVFPVSLTGNAVSCDVPVTVVAGPAIDWSFTEGSNSYSGQTVDVTKDLEPSSGYTVIEYDGDDASDHTIFIFLADVDGVFNVGEKYNTNNAVNTVNTAGFELDDATSIIYTASPLVPTVNVVFTITAFDAATKTLEATFTGTALTSTGNRNITSGKFKATYP